MNTKGRRIRGLEVLSMSALALVLGHAPVHLDLDGPGLALTEVLADSGPSCFVAGTRVRMADGSLRPIEAIRPGDRVLGRGGAVNTVVEVERVPLGARKLYAFNGGKPFVTNEHPFMTRHGWRSIVPASTRAENPALAVAPLREGDRLLVWTEPASGAGAVHGNLALADSPAVGLQEMALTRIEAFAAPADTTLYNLLLDGDHAYFADDYLVHNKGGGGDGGGGGSGGGDDGGGSSGSGGGDDGSGSSGSGGGDDGSGSSGSGGGGDDGGSSGSGAGDDGGNSGPGGASSGRGSTGDDASADAGSGRGHGRGGDDDAGRGRGRGRGEHAEAEHGERGESDQGRGRGRGRGRGEQAGAERADAGRGRGRGERVDAARARQAEAQRGSATHANTRRAGTMRSTTSARVASEVAPVGEALSPEEEAAAIAGNWGGGPRR